MLLSILDRETEREREEKKRRFYHHLYKSIQEQNNNKRGRDKSLQSSIKKPKKTGFLSL